MNERPVAWRLTAGTYWRQTGADAFIVNENGVLRLNPASAALLLVLFGSSSMSETVDPVELMKLSDILVGQRLIEISDSPSDPALQLLESLPANRSEVCS